MKRFLTNMLANLEASKRARAPARRSDRRVRLELESLEDRVVLNARHSDRGVRRQPPTATAPTAIVGNSPSLFNVSYSEAMAASAFAVKNYTLAVDGGFAVAIASVTQTSTSVARINLDAPLPDNRYVLTIDGAVTDPAGNALAYPRTFRFTVPPAVPVFELSAASADTPGSRSTSAGRVTVVGHTNPGVSLTLVGTGLTALASGTGAFQIPGVSLADGKNSLTVQATDVAGSSSHYTLAVTRSSSTVNQPNAVIVWNQAALAAIQQDATDPLFASRGLAMVQAAVFDAVNAIEGTPAYYVKIAAPAGACVAAAVDEAAHDVLTYLYPAQQATFDALLASQLALLPARQATTDGETVGRAAGDAIIALRANDGSRNFVDFTTGTGPGDWQPTPPAYAVPLDPQWAQVTPFALTGPDQFRPAGPPDLTSTQWAVAFNEVKSLGSVTSTTRTADQTQIARFWNDNPGTYSRRATGTPLPKRSPSSKATAWPTTPACSPS